MSIFALNPYKITSLLYRYVYFLNGFGVDFGFSFGKKKTEQQTRTQQDITRDRTTTATQEKTAEQRRETQQETELLGEKQRLELQELFSNFAAQLGTAAGEEDQVGRITELLAQQAEGAVAGDEERIGRIITQQRKEGEQAIGRGTTELAQIAGSQANTVIQALEQAGLTDLSAKLAGTQAELELGAQGRTTDELTKILSSLVGEEGAGVQQLASIGELLKGALATQTGAETAVSEEQMRSEEVLKEIARAITTGTSTATTKEAGFKIGF